MIEMTQERVTRAEAEQVLREVKRVFAAYVTPECKPALIRKWDWGNGPAPYAVVWEEGPYEWAVLATSGGVDEEMTTLEMTLPEYSQYVRTGRMEHPVKLEAIKQPAGVFCEPYTSWALGVYPAW